MLSIQIRNSTLENAPWDLLLLADPSKKNILSYLEKGEIYVAEDSSKTVGVIVLLSVSKDEIELMNIAVANEYQSKGVGKKLVEHAVAISKKKGALRLNVGTGNSSISQIAFYKKNGFRIMGVKKDFFIDNYEEEIIENGIVCRDMILMSMEL